MTGGSALVTSPAAPVYAAPSPAAEMADEALCGCVVRVMYEKGGAVRIRSHYGYEGFVERSSLRSVSRAEAEAWLSGGLAVIDRGLLDVLCVPSVRASRLVCLPAGALVQAVGAADNGWQPVRLADGREGFVPASRLAEKRFGEARLGLGRELPFAEVLDRFYGGSEAAFRAQVIREAEKLLGTQYRWGGRSGFGADCSGLVSLAYMRAGVNIFRDARIEPGFPVKALPPGEEPRPADLLFFPGHVALYLGGGRFIHSTARDGAGVVTGSLRPGPGYRKDLADSLYAVGGIRKEE